MVLKSAVIILFVLIKFATANWVNPTTIDQMQIPEVVQRDSTNIVLSCQYSNHDNQSMVWLFNGDPIPETWNTSVKISDIPTIREIFSSTELTSITTAKKSQLVLRRVTSEMSGNYTCQVHSDGRVMQQTKYMSVFSSENDFTLQISRKKQNTVDVKCSAWGLYPRPEITLEIDKSPMPSQVQRVWWKESAFVAEGTASLRATGKHEVTCRVYLPQADYTAIMKKYVNVGNELCCGSHSNNSNAAILFTIQYYTYITIYIALYASALYL